MIRRWSVLVLLLLSSACATVQTPPSGTVATLAPNKAEQLLAGLKDTNAAIAPYKGIGRIRIQNPDGAWSVRAAWMAAPMGRFRVEAMGLAGNPFAKVICSPDLCSFHFLEDGDVYRKDTRRRSLAPLAGMDVHVEDMVLLLGGGVPLADHDTVVAYESDSGDPVLALRKRFSGIVQIVRFSEDPARVRETEIFNWKGLSYRVLIHEVLRANGLNMPSDLQISDSSGHRLGVSVERCWTDADVSEAAFLPESTGDTGAVP